MLYTALGARSPPLYVIIHYKCIQKFKEGGVFKLKGHFQKLVDTCNVLLHVQVEILHLLQC